MCGIAGGAEIEALMAGLDHRGDTAQIVHDPFPLGHVLLPIVETVKQPVDRGGSLTANCEIYNWRELADDHGIDAENDADLLLGLLDRHGLHTLDLVDGVYAFAYLNEDEVVLARDILGVKPLYFSPDPFAFASERQALEHAGLDARELHPRQVLRYNIDMETCRIEHRSFFTIDDQEQDLAEIVDRTAQLFEDVVRKRVPDEPVAVLLSGGVDSTMIAAVLARSDVDITCYTTGIRHGNTSPPRDRDWAETAANALDLDLVQVEADLADIDAMLPSLADWISSTSSVKLGVAATFHAALQDAEERVVFSGLGAEQLYAGYARQQGELNKECLSGLRGLFHRDLYRDDVVSMRNGCELRLPFLDHSLVRHALTIPGEYKVRDGTRKYVLRKAAERLGVPEEVAWREKRAAQYGSNVDKALTRIAKDQGYGKQAYCNTFRDAPNHRLAALVSGGKDSHAALHRMQQRNNEITCLVNIQSRNPDSYMFDTKSPDIVQRQAAAMNTQFLTEQTDGEKEDELADLEAVLARARDAYGVAGVVAGAIASQYQRDRVEQVCDRLGLKAFAPLWGTDPEAYLRWLVREGFRIQITAVAAQGLDEAWVGRTLDEETVKELIALSREHRFNAAGEGGEYETVAVNAPTFSRPIDT